MLLTLLCSAIIVVCDSVTKHPGVLMQHSKVIACVLASMILAASDVRAQGANSVDVVTPVSALPATKEECMCSRKDALSRRGLENLVAFAHLYGYVRYFHPSNEAFKTEWNAFVIDGARSIEDVPTSSSLASSLQQLFSKVAPTVRVFESGKRVPAPTSSATKSSAQDGVVFWRHEGVRAGTRDMYKGGLYVSQLMIVPKSERGTLDSIPDPDRPFRTELGGGVTAIVPLSLGVALPQNFADRVRVPAIDTTRSLASPRRREVRFAATIIAWNVAQHFYPYFDVTAVDWEAALVRALTRAATDTSTEAFGATLGRMMSELRDGHSQVDIPGSSPFAAPSFRTAWVEGKLVVTALDSASKDPIAVGDVIVSVDGVPAQYVLDHLDSVYTAAKAEPTRNRSIMTLFGFASDTVMTVEVKSASQREAATRKIRVSRSYANFPPVKRLEPVTEVKPGYWYVDIRRMNDSAFNASVPRFAGARGIIFDLRGYPRLSTIKLAGHFVDDTARWGGETMSIPLVLRPNRERMVFLGPRDGKNLPAWSSPETGWVISPVAPRLTNNVIFLTDSRAISYSESTLDMVTKLHLGVIVGSPTAGTNGNVNPFALPGGYGVVWTGMRVLRHDGTRLQGIGITPDIQVRPTISGIAAGRDEVLERGIAEVEARALK